MRKLLSVLITTALLTTLLPTFSANAVPPPPPPPPLTDMPFIASAHNHTLLLSHGGTFTAWGNNSHGQVGLPASSAVYEPNYIDFPIGLIQVSAGAYHSIALDENGNVWSWGSNEFGQLGRTVANTHVPAMINGLSDIIQISAGEFHNIALDGSGDVWAWGRNDFYQLGNTGGQNAVPQQVAGLSNITQIATQFNHNLAIQGSDTIFAWGNNSFGQLGENSSQGTNSATPLEVPNPTGDSVLSIDAGRDHSLMLLEMVNANTTFGWGSNMEYQLGRDDGLPWTYEPIPMFWYSLGNWNIDWLLELGHTMNDIMEMIWNDRGSVDYIWAGEFRTLIRDEDDRTFYTGTGWFFDNETTVHGVDLSADVLTTLTPRWVEYGFVAALGLNHTVALTFQSVNLWGGNEYGQMLTTPTNNQISPTVNYFIEISPIGESVTADEAREMEFTGTLNFIEFTTSNLQPQDFTLHSAWNAGITEVTHINSREFTFEIEPSDVPSPVLTIVQVLDLIIFPEVITTNIMVSRSEWLTVNNFIYRDMFIFSFIHEEDAPPNQITPSDIEFVHGDEDGTEFYIGFRNGRNPNFPLSGPPADVLFGNTPFYTHDTFSLDSDTPLGLHFWGLPDGVTIESVTFESPSSATVTLSGNSTGAFVENITLFVAYIFSTDKNSIDTTDTVGDFPLTSIRQINGRLNMTFTERVAMPIAEPNGGTFTGSQVVALTTETSSATIFFTTDGTVPTITSTEYLAPFALTETTTVRAFAVANGMADSAVLEVRFTRQTGGGSNFSVDTSPLNPNGNDGSTPWENSFVDVSSYDWFYNYVGFAYRNNLMQGVSATEFAPNSPTTRAMFVTVLWRLAGEPTANADNQFADVASETWYSQAIAWAAENGIVLGISETEFAPHVNITREQMAAVIYRSLNVLGFDGAVTQMYFIFEDADEISSFARNAIQTLANMSVMQGNADGTFNPQGLATRAEVAAVMARLSDD